MVEPTARWSGAARRAVDPQRQAAGELMSPASGVIALNKGDPCFATPEPILAAADAAVRAGYTHYPPVLGDADLRARLAADLSARSSRSFTADQVVITVGATGAIAAVLAAYLDSGDEALLLDPTYSAYAPLIRQSGANVVRVPLHPDTFRLDIAALERAVSPRAKLLVLNNPANPTGTVLTTDELAALADFVVSHDLLLVADEVYDRILFDGMEHHSTLELPALDDRLLYVNSFSKTFAMTGWRVGYLAATPELLAAPAMLVGHAVNGVSWPAQRAALAALDAGTEVAAMLRGYATRRTALVDALRATGAVEFSSPQGAFYVFVRFAAATTSRELTATLLRAGVAVRSGSEFGPAGEGYLRLSYSAELADIQAGIEVIAQVLSEPALRASA